MRFKLKYIVNIGIVLFLGLVGFIMFGIYLMGDEDRHGDLVYFSLKVKDRDIIFRCKYTEELRQATDFNEYGIIEKSWDNVYVWDQYNTMKQNLYDWAGKGNGERVRVYRKTSDFDMSEVNLKSGSYNYLMNSDSLEFIVENY